MYSIEYKLPRQRKWRFWNCMIDREAAQQHAEEVRQHLARRNGLQSDSVAVRVSDGLAA